MRFVADLHLHSKYSRAVSRDMTLPIMAEYARKKGINVLSTGDWTHPLWFREIRSQLEEKEEGLYQLKDQISKIKTTSQNSKLETKEPFFFLSVEVSSIYSQGGKTRRIHNLIFSPSFETAEKISQELTRRGCNLMSDGRPIIGLSAKNLLELVLSIDKLAVLVPCHAWTPWFSLYGSNSGFDSIDECFGEYAKYVFGVETGLSSDPLMNWQIKELEKRSIVSFSDAHSPAKMAREATVLDLVSPSYKNIIRALIHPSVLASKNGNSNDPKRLENKIAFTIEFHPEEGKYHYNGHRNCSVVQSPKETKEKGTICPVCKRPLTIGVMQRVEQLAQQSQISNLKSQIDQFGLKWFYDPTENHPPFVKLVPLLEIIAESLDSTVASGKVKNAFDELCGVFGTELAVLMQTPIVDIQKVAGAKVGEGIEKVRANDMAIFPGFDGEYGKVKIWREEKETDNKQEAISNKKKEEAQLGLF